VATRTASLICNRRNVLSFSGVARVAVAPEEFIVQLDGDA
jgi:hypothetical protein